MPPHPPIAVERLVKIYKTVPAVDGISFSLAPGTITALLGGNGAGKTTTIAMIMGLVLPTSGRVAVLGHPMPERRAHVLGRMNFESPYVDMPMRLTVRQNLTVFGKLYDVDHLRERIAELGRELDLVDLLDRRTGNLSAGQKTRVSLAKALINSPDVLLLDEPTRGVDVGSKAEIYRLIGELAAEGKGIIFVSSYLPELLGVCDRLAVMARGRLSEVKPIDQWTPESVMAIATMGISA